MKFLFQWFDLQLNCVCDLVSLHSSLLWRKCVRRRRSRLASPRWLLRRRFFVRRFERGARLGSVASRLRLLFFYHHFESLSSFLTVFGKPSLPPSSTSFRPTSLLLTRAQWYGTRSQSSSWSLVVYSLRRFFLKFLRLGATERRHVICASQWLVEL